MAGAASGVPYERAERVKLAERDRSLGLGEADWPAVVPKGWEATNGALRREIVADRTDASRFPAGLEELILRFPSAPLHGVQRLHEHHVNLELSENFHTFRLLRSSDPVCRTEPVSRVFLMHTGLNEWDRMGLYYRLASQLVRHDPTTVCILRPFPGHLTRYPFQGFAETALDNYLWDGSHLFRQFLRFMLETQWLLSTLVRRSSYRCASGANLLGEAEDPSNSRLRTPVLAAAMYAEWASLHSASVITTEQEAPESQSRRPAVNMPLDEASLERAIGAIREHLGLERHFQEHDGTLVSGADNRGEPELHVLGYSLGGFTAQSVFMSWPFLIASCSTVLAGGALRELAPTGFADPEEWQTVLHSLRYELDDRLMSGNLGVTDDEVAGIDRGLFTHLKRTFYEVFEQEYPGSIQTRLEAFRQRMLFIVGGDDPVVRPESVLQSGPKGGLNLLEIGGLGHFLDGGRDDASKHQQAFWVPEMAALIHRFAANAAQEQVAERPFTWFDADLAKPMLSLDDWNARFRPSEEREIKETAPEVAMVRPLAPTESIGIEVDGALPGELFERCLEDLLYRAGDPTARGVLFILRNEIPTALMHPSAVRENAAALYHDDFSIVRYCHGVTARREVLEQASERICLVLPWNARRLMTALDLQRGFPSQAESAGGRVAKRLDAQDLWDYSLAACHRLAARPRSRHSVRVFDGNTPLPKAASDLKTVIGMAKQYTNSERLTSVPSMPDCWIWVDRSLLVRSDDAKLDTERAVDGIAGAARDICGTSKAMLTAMRQERVRIVNVSRARFNPRFRGRLVVDASAARKRFLHAALCISVSQALADVPRQSAFP